MVSSRNKIFLVLIAILVCSTVYVWRNSSNSFHEMPPHSNIGNTTIFIKTENSLLPDDEVELKKRFPSIIIIGSKKSGTGALIKMLSSHPLIKPRTGEIHFFDEKFERGLTWYLNEMPMTKKNELTIEKSPKYFITSEVPKRIYDFRKSRDVKLILIVRNPITRSVSDYLHWKSKQRQPVSHSIEDMLFKSDGTINTHFGLINVSMYDVHYQRWLKWFDRKEIYVVNGDELITNPVPLLYKLETFVNVPHYFNNSMFVLNKQKGFYCWITSPGEKEPNCMKEGKGKPHPNLSNSTLNKLKKFLKPHAETFCHLAAVNFSWCSL